jgi:predicted PurR-regulated permease PerM
MEGGTGAVVAGRLRQLVFLAAAVVLIAGLYLGRTILLPLAMATMVAFILSPLATWLQRRGLGRGVSVLVVAVIVFSAAGGAAWGISHQITAVLRDLPGYTDILKAKISALRRASRGGTLERARGAVDEVVGEIEKVDPSKRGAGKPVPVVVQEDAGSVMASLVKLVHQGAGVGLVLLLGVFILLERRELRNRLIRLMGYGRLTMTTKALDETGERISQYLLTQSMINAGMGLAFALALVLIGIPYALLCGVVLAVARFVPFVGVWPAVLLPLGLSAVVYESWQQPMLVLGVFLALELLVATAIEPVVFSHRAGVSKVALLVSMAFWTGLWGPLGLVLAMPMTVCLVVLARHVPDLEFVAVLLGDAPVLETSRGFYQRLLAGDSREAAEIVEDRMAKEPLDRVYDDVVVPGLVHARRDRLAGLIAEEERFIMRAAREIVEELAPPHGGAAAAGPVPPAGRPARILGCPLRDEGDHVALLMLRQVAASASCAIEVLGPGLLVSEVLDRIERDRPALFCLAALPPGGRRRTLLLLKRLRARFPDMRVVVGRWGATDAEADRPALMAAGAEHVGLALAETRDHVLALLPVIGAAEPIDAPLDAEAQPAGSA